MAIAPSCFKARHCGSLSWEFQVSLRLAFIGLCPLSLTSVVGLLRGGAHGGSIVRLLAFTEDFQPLDDLICVAFIVVPDFFRQLFIVSCGKVARYRGLVQKSGTVS